MRTLADRIVVVGVLGSIVAVLVARAVVAWTVFRMQRRMTALTKEGLDALQHLTEKIGHER